MATNESAENYLESILKLKEELSRVRAIDIVNELGFSKPSVSIAMKNLKENGYKIGIATGSGRALIEHNTQKCGIAEFFDASIGGDEVENGKPFPDIYLLAAEKMNVPIEDCYIFEDSDNGVLGAVRSGGKTIMVTSLGEANDFAKEHCIGIFNDMHEALTAIKDGTLKK